MLGINAVAPGVKEIIIKPQPAGGIRWACGSYQSVMGVIKSAWKQEPEKFLLQVTLPANSNALIFIPSKQNGTVTEGGRNVNVLRYEKGYAVVETGSGDYSFEVD